MSTQARMGLLAFGIVGGLAMSVTGLVGGYWYAHREVMASTSDPRPLADRPISEGSEVDNASYARGHRWWKRPPTRAKLDALVAFTVETNAEFGVWVDDECRFVRSNETEGRPGSTYHVTPDEMENRRHFWMLFDRGKRPDRATVLRRLRDALDEAEHRDGPGH